MSVFWDKAKKRYRFSFNRKIGERGARVRYRATKLLPKGYSQRQAEAYDQAETKRIYAEASGVESARLKLAPAVQLFLDHRCPELASGPNIAGELLHLFGYIKDAYLDEVADIAARYRKDARKVRKGVVGKPLAAATVRNRLAYLKSAVRYARVVHKYGRGLPDYTEDMDIPVVDNERQVYAKLPELRKLWRALNDPEEEPAGETAALFTLVFYLGLRWHKELLTRLPEHIERHGRDVWLELGRTKSGDAIKKFVHPKARAALRFIPFTHGATYYYRRWRAGVAEIGRPDLRPHDLRHSLASDVISRPGGSLDDVRMALHHRSLQAAKRYAHPYPERVKAVLGATGASQKSAHRRR